MFHIFKFVSIVSIVSNYREETVPRDDKAGRSLLYDGGEGRKERGKRKGEKGKRKENFAQRSSLIFFLSEIQKQNVGDHGRRPSIVCCLLNILNCEPGSNELLQNHIK